MSQLNPWINLILVSTLDKPRNKAQISRAWDIAVSGGPLYETELNKQIDDAVESGLLEKEKGKYQANIKSERFKKELEDYIDQKINKEGIDYRTAQYFAIALENIEDFIDFLADSKIRKNLFDIEIVKKYFMNKQKAKKEPWSLFTTVSEIFVYPYTIEYLENSEKIPNDIKPIFKPMIEQTLEPQISSNQKELKKTLIDLYEDYPDKFKALEEMYKGVLENSLNDLTSSL